MSAAWQTDLSAAEQWAADQINTVSTARGWSAEWLVVANEAIDEAIPAGFQAWFADPQDFFADLTVEWSEAGQGTDPPDGWDELGRVWASAGDAAYTAAEEERLGSVSTMVADTVTSSAADVTKAGDATLGFFSPTKGWLDPSGYKFWMPVAGGLGLYLLLRKR